MLIGLISDSHDNLSNLEKAIELLNQKRVDLVLHAGDFVSPFVVEKFKNLNCKLIGVLGNNDGDVAFLRQRFSETINCEIRGRFAEVTIDNFRIALLHGDDLVLLNVLINSDCFEAVIYGHSHVSMVRENKNTLVINPGELCGYLTGKSTYGLLDTQKREVQIIEF
ncbi:MAG: metallophosphoesterase [Crenarchaeota archaeon]|nr:metallophosphoesterase [Thermoproteota archaeon]